MEIPRSVPLLAVLGAIALMVAAADRFHFHFGYEWELLVAAVMTFGWPASRAGPPNDQIFGESSLDGSRRKWNGSEKN